MYEHLSILPVPPRKSKGRQPLGRVPAPKRESDPAFWKFQGRYGRTARSRCRSRSQRQQGEMSRRQHAPARFKVAGQRARLREARPDRRSAQPPQGNLAAVAACRCARRGCSSPQVCDGEGSRCHLQLARLPTSMRVGSGPIRFFGEAGAARYAARDYWWRPGGQGSCRSGRATGRCTLLQVAADTERAAQRADTVRTAQPGSAGRAGTCSAVDSPSSIRTDRRTGREA